MGDGWQDVSNNQLTELPSGLGRLGRLQKLHLCRNKLARLPDSLPLLTGKTRTPAGFRIRPPFLKKSHLCPAPLRRCEATGLQQQPPERRPPQPVADGGPGAALPAPQQAAPTPAA